jgi:hypothetical protein
LTFLFLKFLSIIQNFWSLKVRFLPLLLEKACPELDSGTGFQLLQE